MSYIKGVNENFDFPGFNAEPIIFNNPDGTYRSLGWNILFEINGELPPGDLTVGDGKTNYTFCNVKTIDTPIKDELLLLFATNLLVNA